MRALILVLLLSTACAAVLRGNTRDLNVYGPDDLRVLDQGRELIARPAGRERGMIKYELQVPKGTENLMVEAEGFQAPVKLEQHASAGWVVLDVVFIIYLVPLIVDWATSSWSNYTDVDAMGPLVAAGFREGQSGPVASHAVASRQSDAESERAAMERQRASASKPAPAERKAVVDHGKLAVLDFKNSAKDLQQDEVRYFTDVVRGASLKVAPGLEVMTRENLITLLQATGKDLGQCEGECEVDTGRRIGADAIISGDVLKVGSKYHISLRLHETHDGRLLSSAIATGKSVDELDEGLQSAAAELLMPAR